jgi:hypothetical protein
LRGGSIVLERITWLGLTGTVAILLMGCAASRDATGYLGGLLSAPGRSTTGVEFRWTGDSSGVRGTVTVALPSGERFTGNFVQVTREVPDTELVPMVNPITGFTDAVAREGGTTMPDVWANAVELGAFREEYANRIVAVLFGDRGNAMRCGFRLIDPPAGFRGGGTGACRISYDNGTIAVQF